MKNGQDGRRARPRWCGALVMMLLFGLAAGAAAAQEAPPAPAGTPDRPGPAQLRDALGSLYAGALLAWFVEGRCRILSHDDVLRFEWGVGTLTRALLQAGVAPEDVGGLQEASAAAADDAAAYPCDAAGTRDYVSKAVAATDRMVPQLTGLSYDAATAFLDRHGILYQAATAALAVGDLCPALVDPKRRQAYEALIADVERRAKANGVPLADFRAEALTWAGGVKACDAGAEALVAEAAGIFDELAP